MKVNVGLGKDAIESIVNELSGATADLVVLSIKTLRCHWNMEDARFYFLHELLDEQYHQLIQDIDLVAERIRQLGHHVRATLRDFLEESRLKEMDTDSSAQDMLSGLSEAYEELIRIFRKDIDLFEKLGDPGSADLFTQLLRQYEKAAWILRSHL